MTQLWTKRVAPLQDVCDNVYILAGIAPPGVRMATTYQQERRKQTEDPRHSIYSQEHVRKRMKSRNSFVTPFDRNTQAERLIAWTHHLRSVPQELKCPLTKNWNRPLQVKHAKMEIQWCWHHIWLWGADTDNGPSVKVSYAASSNVRLKI